MIFTVHRTATAGLVGTNQLSELSLSGECVGQGEHQEGSKGEIVIMLLVLTGQSPQTLLILLYVQLPQLIVYLHLLDSCLHLDSFQFHSLTIGLRT